MFYNINEYIEIYIRQLLLKIAQDYNLNYYSLLSSISELKNDNVDL